MAMLPPGVLERPEATASGRSAAGGSGVLGGRCAPPALFSSDTSVQGTNDDAQVSKLSCAKAGYFRDDFISFFVKKSARRSPLINRGYFARHTALRQLLVDFLQRAGPDAQVLSLGAGFDTAWWQIAQDQPELLPARYLEVDFKEVTKRKAAIISGQPKLLDPLRAANRGGGGGGGGRATDATPGQQEKASAAAAASGGSTNESGPGDSGSCCSDGDGGVHVDVAGGAVRSRRYSLLPVDMSEDLSNLDAAVASAGLDPSLPTYLLSECVLVYMDAADSAAVVRWAAARFPRSAALVVYEQLNPGDAFGRQMCSNLESRGCPLRGVASTPTLQAHEERMTRNGWQAATSRTMDNIYQTCLPPDVKQRAERLEVFDEFEEWHMMMDHYCITVGVNSRDGGGGGGGAGGRLHGFGLRDLDQQQQALRPLPGQPGWLPTAD